MANEEGQFVRNKLHICFTNFQGKFNYKIHFNHRKMGGQQLSLDSLVQLIFIPKLKMLCYKTKSVRSTTISANTMNKSARRRYISKRSQLDTYPKRMENEKTNIRESNVSVLDWHISLRHYKILSYQLDGKMLLTTVAFLFLFGN